MFKKSGQQKFMNKFDNMIVKAIQTADSRGHNLLVNNTNIDESLANFIEFVKYCRNEEKKNETKFRILSESIIEPLSYYFCLLNILKYDIYEINEDKKTKHIILYDNKYNTELQIDAFQLIYDVIVNHVKFERLEFVLNLLNGVADKKINSNNIKSEIAKIQDMTLYM